MTSQGIAQIFDLSDKAEVCLMFHLIGPYTVMSCSSGIIGIRIARLMRFIRKFKDDAPCDTALVILGLDILPVFRNDICLRVFILAGNSFIITVCPELGDHDIGTRRLRTDFIKQGVDILE